VVEGVGHALPDRVVTTAEVAARVSAASGLRLDPRVIVRLSGVESRRFAGRGETPSSLAAAAAEHALVRAGRTVRDIDLIVNASASQDMAEPSTAAFVQERLGCADIAAFDVKNACNGFLTALELTRVLIESGAHRRALVVAAEVVSHNITWSLEDSRELALRFANYTAGDAGGACIIGASDDPDRGLRPGHFISDGRLWRLCAATVEGSRIQLATSSAELERIALDRVPPIVLRVLAQESWTAEAVDLFVPHQASVPAIERACQVVGVPFDRCMVTATELGNTAAASMPLALSLAQEQGRLPHGSKVLLVGSASGFSGGVMPIIW
jgi:3-oxoacyl-[acyl-carrier-protein] synthase-3